MTGADFGGLLTCPVCGAALGQEAGSLRCPAGHCFDLARQGHVNLLTVDRRHSKSPGDTAEQVRARRAFLNAGTYAPIAAAMVRLLSPCLPEGGTFLDAGCGEGWYLTQLLSARPDLRAAGLDISKEAVRAAAAQHKNACWLVATAAHMPLADHCLDGLSSMFAMTAPEEFARVLKPGACFLQVLAGQDHLMALKRIIYPEILRRDKVLQPDLPGFALVTSETLDFPVELRDAGSVMALLAMTPHIYRITAEGLQRARQTEALNDRAQVVLNLYRKDG